MLQYNHDDPRKARWWIGRPHARARDARGRARDPARAVLYCLALLLSLSSLRVFAEGGLQPDPAFAHYPQYRGTMNGQAIVLRIGPKPDDPDELNGEYEYLPRGPVLLIAGARNGNTLTLEESDDGTRISGQWVGFFADKGSLSGERMDPDNSHAVSFELQATSPVSP